MLSKIAIATILLSVLSGCGTIVRGTTEDVAINASPASANVETSTGQRCVGSCVIEVPRKDSFTVTASAPGYEPQTVSVKSSLSGGGAAGLAGNVVFGGVIGVGVDAVSGAAYDHTPNPVNIQLRPAQRDTRYVPRPAATSEETVYYGY